MLSRLVPLIVLATLGLTAIRPGGAAPAPERARPSEHAIDPVHSFVLFKVMNRGVSHVYGRFGGIAGNVLLDDDGRPSGIFVEIDAATVDTGNPKRDDHLRSPDFFSVKEHPTITFESEEIEAAGEDHFRVRGDLTLLGKSQPVSFEFTRTGMQELVPGEVHTGAEATFEVNRSDFGMSFLLPSVADEVTLIVDIEAIGR